MVTVLGAGGAKSPCRSWLARQVGFRITSPPRSVVEASAAEGFVHASADGLDNVLEHIGVAGSFKLRWRNVQAILQFFQTTWQCTEVPS